MIWQSYRYDAFGSMTFGQPQYNNVYSYNGESYNPNIDAQYLRARYYSPTTADFISEDSYLGDITDPLSLNRYNYTKSSPLNYMDPSGHKVEASTMKKASDKKEVDFCSDQAKSFISNMMEQFGFMDNEAKLLYKFYSYFSTDPEYEKDNTKKFWSIMGSMIYNKGSWQIMTGAVSEKKARSIMQKVGLTKEEAKILGDAIINQHNVSSYSSVEEYVEEVFEKRYEEFDKDKRTRFNTLFEQFTGKTDFAHMAITIATNMTDDDSKIATVIDGISGQDSGIWDRKKNAGYAGDIYGANGIEPKMGGDDYNADLDAVNLSSRFESESNVIDVINDYFTGMETGDVSRSKEFLSNIGNGSLEIGYIKLEKEREQSYSYYKAKNKKASEEQVNQHFATADKFLEHLKNQRDWWDETL